MLGWVSSAMATASSTESTLPKTFDPGLVTGGGGEVAGGGVCVGGGAIGACAAALLVVTTRAAPASSNCRAPILIAIALPGPDHALCVTCQDRGTRRGYHAPRDGHAGRRRAKPNGARACGGRAVDKPRTRGGWPVDSFLLDEREILRG